MEPSRRFHFGRIAVVTAVLVLAAVLLFSGVLDDFSLEETAACVRSFGAAGFVVFLLAFTFIQPLGVSAHPFILAAALVWPPPIAFGLSLAGAMGSSLVNLAFVRWVAFDWVQARIPDRLRKYERWLTDRGLLGVSGPPPSPRQARSQRPSRIPAVNERSPGQWCPALSRWTGKEDPTVRLCTPRRGLITERGRALGVHCDVEPGPLFYW